MSDQNNNSNTPPQRHGLRLIKSAPSEVIDEITAGGVDPKTRAAAFAKTNPLVRQLSGLADAIDAEVAFILKM